VASYSQRGVHRERTKVGRKKMMDRMVGLLTWQARVGRPPAATTIITITASPVTSFECHTDAHVCVRACSLGALSSRDAPRVRRRPPCRLVPSRGDRLARARSSGNQRRRVPPLQVFSLAAGPVTAVVTAWTSSMAALSIAVVVGGGVEPTSGSLRLTRSSSIDRVRSITKQARTVRCLLASHD